MAALDTAAPAPLFPLSAADLAYYSRLAARGGIGSATALVDRVGAGPDELMFMQGDTIILLHRLDSLQYLGFCEEIVGAFPMDAVDVIHYSMSHSVSATSPKLPSTSSSSPKFPHSSTGSAPSDSLPKRADPPQPLDTSMSDLAARTRRRRMNVAGLGIDDGPSSPRLFWTEDALGEPASPLSPSPNSPACSSLATPSLLTSPSSDFDGNDRDSLTTPPVPHWNSSVSVEENSTSAYASASPKSSDEPTDSYPIISHFPFPSHPGLPAAKSASDVAASNLKALRSQFSDLSLATSASRLKISDAPTEDLPLLPSAFSSPSSHHQSIFRAPKSSDASSRSDGSGGSARGPATPGEDHTLAMIFDSYRYSTGSVATLDGPLDQSTTRGSDERGVITTRQKREEETEELSELESPGGQATSGAPPKESFRFGAASTLRMEVMAGRGKQTDEELPPRQTRTSNESFDFNTIPRLSTIFPRSATAESLESLPISQGSGSSSVTDSVPIENPTAELDAARRLFDNHLHAARETPARPSGLPDSPIRERSLPGQKSIKGLAISAPTISGFPRPTWPAQVLSSPGLAPSHDPSSVPRSPAPPSPFAVRQIPSPSSFDPPRVALHGPPPSRQLDYDEASDPSPSSVQHLQATTIASVPSSPALSSEGLCSPSSPSSSVFTEEWRMPREMEHAPKSPSQPSLSARLRRPNLRLKTAAASPQQISSPITVDMVQSPTFASASNQDVFLSSPRPPPVPSQTPYSSQNPPTPAQLPPQSPRQLNHKTSRGLFSRKFSGRAEASLPPSPVPAVLPIVNKGISSKDFEDETVKVNGGEFDIVKPLKDALGVPSLASPTRHVDDGESSEGGHTEGDRSLGASCSSRDPDTSTGSIALDEQSVENHRAKELAWVKALNQMGVSDMRKSKKIRALVHAGVPSSLRGRVWGLFAGTSDVKVEGVYRTLCDSDPLPIDDEIELDIERTLHHHPQFLPIAQELETVVKAFARYNEKLGYAPSMGSLCGLILTQVADGETAFWTLVALVKNFGLGQFLPAGRAQVRVAVLAFGFIVEATDPKLARRMLELAVDPSLYYKRWMSTFFVDTLPWSTVLPLVDLILFDSASYQLRAALAILELSQLTEAANFPTRESVLHWLLHPPAASFAPTLLMPTLHTIKLREDRIRRAFKRAEGIISGGDDRR